MPGPVSDSYGGPPDLECRICGEPVYFLGWEGGKEVLNCHSCGDLKPEEVINLGVVT